MTITNYLIEEYTITELQDWNLTFGNFTGTWSQGGMAGYSAWPGRYREMSWRRMEVGGARLVAVVSVQCWSSFVDLYIFPHPTAGHVVNFAHHLDEIEEGSMTCQINVFLDCRVGVCSLNLLPRVHSVSLMYSLWHSWPSHHMIKSQWCDEKSSFNAPTQ